MEKRSIKISFMVAFIILLGLFFLSGAVLYAQEKNEKSTEKGKEKKTTVYLKVIKQGEKGEEVTMDTVITYKTEEPVTFIKKKNREHVIIHPNDAIVAWENFENIFSDIPEMNDFQMDIPDFESESWTGDEDTWNSSCDYWKDRRRCHLFDRIDRLDSWLNGMTPWGKIREIKVKVKKGGKKVVIRTEDFDQFSIPPVPPMPPLQPRSPKVNKIIIEKGRINKAREKQEIEKEIDK